MIGPLRYVGAGSFYFGVPARDLTAEEAEQHREIVENSPLYAPLEQQPAGADDIAQPAGADDEGEGE
jgi:hypothetical protein